MKLKNSLCFSLKRRINIQIVFIYLMIISLPVQAQQWQILNGPYGGEVYKFAIDPNQTNIIYAAVDAWNKLYKSTDSGNSWRDIGPERETGSYDPTVTLDPTNSSIIYLSSEFGVLDKSTDGGITWKKKYLLKDSVNSFINSIAIDPLSPNIIYVGLVYESNRTLWKSTDGGESWCVKTSGMPKRDFPTRSTKAIKINPLNTSVIYANVSDFGLYRSDNAAEDWHYIGFDNSSIYDIEIIPWDTASVLVAAEGGFYKSTDGGTNWSEPMLNYSILSIEIDTSTRILYAGTKGNWAYKSTDYGDTWNSIISQEIPTSESLAMNVYDILIDSNESNNMYLGTGVGPYKSIDEGNSWIQSFNGIRGFKTYDIKISPSNPSIIYAAGFRGVYRSNDRGISWSYIGVSEPVVKINVDPFTQDIVYGSVDTPISELTIRTTNGGDEWNYMPPCTSIFFPFIEIDRSDQRVVYVSELPNQFLRSFDYGTTWDTINSPTIPTSLAVANDDPNLLYISSYEGVYKSTDRGETWNPLNIFTYNNSSSVFLDPSISQKVYGVIKFTGIFKSTDGGNEWVKKNNGLDSQSYFSTVDLYINPQNTKEIFLVRDSIIYQSINGGDLWSLLEPSPPGRNIYALDIDTSSGTRLLVSSDLPGIYALDLTSTSVEEIGHKQLPISIELLQNYPNPFNPTTKIKYSIPQSGFVTIKVFNLLGEELTTLVNQEQSAGEYFKEFDASRLVSGIYIYKLQSGDYSMAKKMVLLK